MRVVVAGAGSAGLLAADRIARAGQLGLRFADTAMSSYEREPRGGAATTHPAMARCAAWVAAGDDELIAAPLGRVRFAGEHTAGAWSGLMEGALRSGARAADEVLAHAVR